MNMENITEINNGLSDEKKKRIERLRALAIEKADNKELAKAISELSEQQILDILGDNFEEEMNAPEERSAQEETRLSDTINPEDKTDSEVETNITLAEAAEGEKKDFSAKKFKAILIAAAVIVVGLCVTVIVMVVSYSGKIDELNKKISDNSKIIVKLQTENDKLKNRAEELTAVIQKAKKKKEAARKKAKAKSDKDLVEAQKNTSAIAIYSTGDTGVLTKSKGVVYYKGHKETYYSSRVLRHKDIGSWSVDARGVYRDSNGYVCVASNSSDLSAGQLVLTSMGIARVHDSGCAKGTIDLYVNW